MYKPPAGVDNLPDIVDNRAELLTKLYFREELHARTRSAPAGRRRRTAAVITAPDAAQPAGPSPAGRRRACADRRGRLLHLYYTHYYTHIIIVL